MVKGSFNAGHSFSIMGWQHLVNDVNAVGLLELQQRRHHAHAAVDERVVDHLAGGAALSDEETLAWRQGSPARPSSARGLACPNSMPKAGWMPLTRSSSSVDEAFMAQVLIPTAQNTLASAPPSTTSTVPVM